MNYDIDIARKVGKYLIDKRLIAEFPKLPKSSTFLKPTQSDFKKKICKFCTSLITNEEFCPFCGEKIVNKD